MKNKKIKLIQIYYFILAFVLISQAVITVYQLGHTVSYQHRIARLEQKKQELIKNQQAIELELGQITALSLNQAKLNEEYIDIQSPIRLTIDDSVALK